MASRAKTKAEAIVTAINNLTLPQAAQQAVFHKRLISQVDVDQLADGNQHLFVTYLAAEVDPNTTVDRCGGQWQDNLIVQSLRKLTRSTDPTQPFDQDQIDEAVENIEIHFTGVFEFTADWRLRPERHSVANILVDDTWLDSGVAYGEITLSLGG